MNMKPLFVSIGLSLSLCVACGGSDSGGNGSQGGSGGSSPGASGSGNPGGIGPSGGGAANTSSGSYSSGLPGDRQLGSLTADEYAALCQKLSAYFADGSGPAKSLGEFACRSAGAIGALFSGANTDAALQAACKPLYDKCIASPTTSEEKCDKQDTTCTATVAEYDTCVNDELKALNQAVNALPSCDKLTLALLSSPSPGADSESIPSCDALKAKCPNLTTPADGVNQ